MRRDFVSKYKQTILGPLWAVIQPLLTTIVFTVIFGSLANLTTLDVKATEETVIPAFRFYMQVRSAGAIFHRRSAVRQTHL